MAVRQGGNCTINGRAGIVLRSCADGEGFWGGLGLGFGGAGVARDGL
jgi:hypothetical protein